MSSRTGSHLPPRAMEAAKGWRIPRHEEHSDFAHCTGEGSRIDSQFAGRSRTRSVLKPRNDTCWETKGGGFYPNMRVFARICRTSGYKRARLDEILNFGCPTEGTACLSDCRPI